MHIIKREPFVTANQFYLNCADALDAPYLALKSSMAKTLDQLKQIFPSLDNFKYVNKWYLINIGGTTLRLIAFI